MYVNGRFSIAMIDYYKNLADFQSVFKLWHFVGPSTGGTESGHENIETEVPFRPNPPIQRISTMSLTNKPQENPKID